MSSRQVVSASSSKSSDEDDSDEFLGWNHEVRQSRATLENDHNSIYNSNSNIEEQQEQTEEEHPNSGSDTGVTDPTTVEPIIEHFGSQEKHENASLNSNNSFSNSDDSDDDTTSTNDRWSLSIRINSVVDLPSSIIPSTPLCPLMKFGLITITDENEKRDLEISSASFRREEYEQREMKIHEENGKQALQPQQTPMIPQGSLRIMTMSESKTKRASSLSTFQQSVPIENIISKSSQDLEIVPQIHQTSGKITSQKDNGMMEWHEEMRWDDVELPLQTVLCIELLTRAVFPPSSLVASSTSSRTNTTNNMSSSTSDADMSMYESWPQRRNDTSSSTNESRDESTSQHDNSGNGNGNGGLLGFWRKGRQNRRGRMSSISSTGATNTSSNHGSETGDLNEEDQKEMEKAAAAAAVARYLMNNGGSANENMDEESNEFDQEKSTSNEAKELADDINLSGKGSDDQFSPINSSPSLEAGDIRLGTLLIPISNLPLEDEVPTVEKWYQFDSLTTGKQLAQKKFDSEISSPSKVPTLRSPSVLLQISLSSKETLDEIEEEAYLLYGGGESEKGQDDTGSLINNPHQIPGGSKREITSAGSNRERTGSGVTGDQSLTEKLKQDQIRREEEEQKLRENGPYLEPGLVDFICVVGAKDLGNQKNDNGNKGWVESDPECTVLEQFPPVGFHNLNGRQCSLPDKVEWWCFPEGYRLWRGSEPPTHMDMNLKRFSASSPPRMASSIAAFDACLDCTSSFMWWVMSSNSDTYGSLAKKIYGAVIRFYVPAPLDTDGTKDNFENEDDEAERKRLWCPIGICLTSSLPIVGILEAILLRLCENLASRININNISDKVIHKDIMNLMMNYQSPIAGVINCSIPFLSGDGDRLLISIPSISGLPPLPHGASVISVCRLLGAEGLTQLLAAVLTECKILIHSADVSNLAMVAEVITALIYPFTYQLPFIPVIPIALMEIIEAPVSYFIGVPTCNMKWVDKSVLADVVVIDLDNGFSTPDYFDGRRSAPSSRATTPLPASVSSNLSKAVFRLLRDEEEVEDQFGTLNFSETRHLPRMDVESLAERKFRIAVAQQICSFIRGYQECLFFVSVNQPVFNRDRFLRQAPALFEDRGGGGPISPTSLGHLEQFEGTSQRILSPRSKRFLSGLVNTQHFHDLLERLDSESTTFFHRIMDSFQITTEENKVVEKNQAHVYGSFQQTEIASQLCAYLDDIEQQIPTYHVHRDGNRPRDGYGSNSNIEDDDLLDYHYDGGSCLSSFTSMLLRKVDDQSKPPRNDSDKAYRSRLEAHMLSEKIPWQYSTLFDIKLVPDGEVGDDTKSVQSALWSKIQLKEALGERKFRAWKLQEEKKDFVSDDASKGGHKGVDHRKNKSAIDLTKLLPSDYDGGGRQAGNFVSRMKTRGSMLPGVSKVIDERDVVRQYIEKAYEVVRMEEDDLLDDKQNDFAAFNLFISNGTNTEVENALCNPSAQRFLISVLNQRTRLQTNADYNGDVSISRLQPIVFECLVHLCGAMLNACMKDYDYESAYRLLTHTTGFCTVTSTLVEGADGPSDDIAEVSYMTKQVGMHPIYADLRLWHRVLLLHQQDRQKDRTSTGSERFADRVSMESDEYEATVATLYEMLGYSMPADDLARFASRIATEKFFSTEKEQKILVLTRKLALKSDEAADRKIVSSNAPVKVNDIMDESYHQVDLVDETNASWEEVTWSHPCSSAPFGMTSCQDNIEGFTGQCPITALASFGSSVVASGALDGSVFIAHTLNLEHKDTWDSSKPKARYVKGVRLELQKLNGSYSSVGAISCLAASRGSTRSVQSDAFAPDKVLNSEAFLGSVAGCRIIGGTTNGDLRVWNLQDVLSKELTGDTDDITSLMSESYNQSADFHSSHARKYSSTKTSQAQTGQVLGYHRGGVTCLSVPAQIYRPDSLISGGNDGLIKLWSLRDDLTGQSRRKSMGGRTSRMLFSGRERNPNRADPEAVNVLAGHGGRILCVETAWHGDRLLSGAADLTMKLWDLASSGGKCIQTMHGHTG